MKSANQWTTDTTKDMKYQKIALLLSAALLFSCTDKPQNDPAPAYYHKIYEAKYVTDTSVAYIPARISEEVEETVREAAVKVYSAIGCQGLSRVDFFVTYEGERVVFNEINTLPGFTSISMYPKLFAASGIPYSELIDELLKLAMEAFA